MYFRPQPVLTLVSCAALACLLWLGAWQTGRADWKRELLSEFEALGAAAVSWEEGVCPFLDGESLETASPIDGALVTAQLAAGSSEQDGLRLFGQSPEGVVGWRVLQPVRVVSCGVEPTVVLVESGFEPESVGPELGVRVAPPDRYRVEPWVGRSMFSPVNSPELNQWYWLDPVVLAESIGDGELNLNIIVTGFSGVPANLARTPPAQHLAYAATWFGLALCLVFVYVTYHLRTGRLSVSKSEQPGS